MSSEYFSKYLEEIGNYPLLSAERETDLCEIIERGRRPNASGAEAQASETARSELARHNLRLVVSVAKRFRDSILPMEDLIFAGNVGLVKATKRFNGTLFKARFSTFAYYWILQSIHDALWRGRLIRTPMRHAGVWQRLREAHSFREDQVSQDVEQLHLETRIPEHTIRLVLKHQCLFISLDKPAVDSSDEGIGAVIPSDSETPATIFGNQEKLVNLADALILLTPRERIVISHRFGLNGLEFKKLEKLAADFGVTRERVRQIMELALDKLREKFETLGDCFHESEVGKSQPLTRKPVHIAPELLKTVSIQQLRSKTDELVRAILLRGEIWVTDNGRKIAKIVPENDRTGDPYFAKRKPASAFLKLDHSGKTDRGTDVTRSISTDREDRH
jgi:RNA polymerase primary sigma factor